MEDFRGMICPFCQSEIKEGDGVVVCPSCGIAHHESCWEENKGCATFGCSEQHGEAHDTIPADVCPNCGAILDDDQMYCPKCGAGRAGGKQNICSKCGAELLEGQIFCPKCGQKVEQTVNAETEQKKRKNKIISIALGAVGVVVVLVLIFALRKPSVDEIILSKSSVELKVDETAKVSYTINPEKASEVSVEWKSSDKDIATVSSKGRITAKGEGTCKVTATAGKKTDTVTVVVKSGPDFKSVYNIYCDPDWAYVAFDGSYLTVDTNPNDWDDYSDYEVYSALFSIHEALGLPESLIEKMGQTRALDGRQSSTYDNITVSWTYHPDQGLEVMYEAN